MRVVKGGNFMEVSDIGPDFWRGLAETVLGGEYGGCAGELDECPCFWDALDEGEDAGIVICIC
jgi:hypothetical protein